MQDVAVSSATHSTEPRGARRKQNHRLLRRALHGGNRRHSLAEQARALPDLAAGCSLAATINAEQLREWKAEHPGAVVVSYVNTTAEVKAESDYCCTSGNAVEVVNSIPPEKEILFLPDMFSERMCVGDWSENIHV